MTMHSCATKKALKFNLVSLKLQEKFSVLTLFPDIYNMQLIFCAFVSIDDSKRGPR